MQSSSLKGDNPLRFFIDLYQLNQRSNSPPPLIQLAKTDNSIRNYLFRIIQASAEDKAFETAAANAITILNEARASLSGQNFSGVRISGADLTQAIADEAIFDQADVLKVRFVEAQLIGASFKDSEKEGAEFTDELFEPIAQQTLTGHKTGVISLCEIPEGLVASSSSDEKIKIWDSKKNFICIKNLDHASGAIFDSTPTYPPVIKWLKKYQLLVSMSSEYIRIWNPQKDYKCIKKISCKDACRLFVELSDGSFMIWDNKKLKIFDPGKKFQCSYEEKLAGNGCNYCELQDGVIAQSGTPDDENSFSGVYKILNSRKSTFIVILKPILSSQGKVIKYTTVKIIPCEEELGGITNLFANEQGHLVCTHEKGNARVLDPKQDFECIHSIPTLVNPSQINKLSENLIGSEYFFDNNAIELRTANTDFSLLTAQILKGHTKSIQTLCKLTNGLLLSGSMDGTIKVWGPKKNKIKHRDPITFNLPQSFTNIVNLEKLYSYFNNIGPKYDLFGLESTSSRKKLQTNTNTNTDNKLSDRGLENLCDQLLGDAVYFFNNSSMEAISTAKEETSKLPIPHQYAKAIIDCSRGDLGLLNKLLSQGKRLDKPIVSVCRRSTLTQRQSDSTAVYMVLPDKYSFSPPYFQEEHTVDEKTLAFLLWFNGSENEEVGLLPENKLRRTEKFSLEVIRRDQNYKVFYQIIMFLCGDKGIADPPLETVRLICDLFYERNMKSFLQIFNQKTGVGLDIRKDIKYLSPAGHLESYAFYEPHPILVLEGYETLYSEYIELINVITERVYKIADERGLLLPMKEKSEKYRAFLQLALYQNGQLQEVLKQAHQRKWLVKPYPQLNLINLVIPIVLAFENRDGWGELLLSINQFDNKDSNEYRRILAFLGARIQEALSSKGIMSSWYDQMAQKLSLFKSQSSIVLFDPVLKPTVPTISILPIKLNEVLLPAFPIEDVKKVLSFLKEINLENILQKGVEGKITKEFSFSERRFNISRKVDHHSLTRIIAANLTLDTLFSIYSKTEASIPNVLRFLKSLYFGQDVLQPSEDLYGKKLSGIITSLKALLEYFEAFYIMQGGEKVIDHETLALKLLKDKELHDLLMNDSIKQQIVQICSVVRIPELNKETAEKGINAFIKFQKIVLSLPEKEKILTYADLAKHLLFHKFQESASLVSEVLELMKKLEKVMHHLLEPPIQGIQILAHPEVKKLLQKDSKWIPKKNENIENPVVNEEFYNCQDRFRSFHNEIFGELVDDPIADQIHKRICDLYYFTNKEEKGSPQTTLCIDAEQFYFREFSFKRSQFHNFNFTRTCLEECDFTDVTFSGTITFSQTYMDSTTAKTFLPALYRALVRGGDFQIQGKKGIILCNLKDKEKNGVQNIPDELMDYLDTRYVDWLAPEAYLSTFTKLERPPLPISSTSLRVSNINSPRKPQQTDSPSFLDTLWGGLGEIVGQIANTTNAFIDNLFSNESSPATVQGLQRYYSAGGKNHASTALKYNEEEIFEYHKEVTELNMLKENMLNAQRHQQAVNVHLDNNQESLRLAFEEQQMMINSLVGYVNLLQSGKIEKEKIKLQQEKLLKRNDQVTVFYQTFLTELCSSLQIILILQNNIKLIEPSQGKVTKISNKQNKFGMLIETARRDPNKIEKAYQWMIAIKDHVVGVAEIAKPFLSLIPYEIGSVANVAVDFIQKTNDQNKLSKTKAAYRGLTVKTLDKMADAIARKMAYAYQEQILLLSADGAVHFAECGVLRLIAALFNGYIESSEHFASQAWWAIRSFWTYQNAKFLGIEIPLTQRKLEANNKKDYYTGDELYRRAGVAYQKVKHEWVYFSNDKKNSGEPPFPEAVATKADQFGYMRVSKEEWEKYFRHSVTLDSNRTLSAHTFSKNNDPRISLPIEPTVDNKPITQAKVIPVGQFLVMDQGKILAQLEEQGKQIKQLQEANERLMKRLDSEQNDKK